jgi:hypothetical protein
MRQPQPAIYWPLVQCDSLEPFSFHVSDFLFVQASRHLDCWSRYREGDCG